MRCCEGGSCRTRDPSTIVFRETGTDLAPDKKEARSDRGTESDASAALAALARGPKLQSCISVTEYFEPGQQ